MYEPVLDFIRSVELYNSEKEQPIDVYLLKFDGMFEVPEFR